MDNTEIFSNLKLKFLNKEEYHLNEITDYIRKEKAIIIQPESKIGLKEKVIEIHKVMMVIYGKIVDDSNYSIIINKGIVNQCDLNKQEKLIIYLRDNAKHRGTRSCVKFAYLEYNSKIRQFNAKTPNLPSSEVKKEIRKEIRSNNNNRINIHERSDFYIKLNHPLLILYYNMIPSGILAVIPKINNLLQRLSNLLVMDGSKYAILLEDIDYYDLSCFFPSSSNNQNYLKVNDESIQKHLAYNNIFFDLNLSHLETITTTTTSSPQPQITFEPINVNYFNNKTTKLFPILEITKKLLAYLTIIK
ncbi:hypothetical protein ACTFIY_003020 [Dictyostelium cf. discoideum]